MVARREEAHNNMPNPIPLGAVCPKYAWRPCQCGDDCALNPRPAGVARPKTTGFSQNETPADKEPPAQLPAKEGTQ